MWRKKKMNEQIKWYIEQALKSGRFEGVHPDTEPSEVIERPHLYGDVLYKALELAVRDVG